MFFRRFFKSRSRIAFLGAAAVVAVLLPLMVLTASGDNHTLTETDHNVAADGEWYAEVAAGGVQNWFFHTTDYREQQLIALTEVAPYGSSLSVSLNGQELGSATDQAYFIVALESGDHQVSIRNDGEGPVQYELYLGVINFALGSISPSNASINFSGGQAAFNFTMDVAILNRACLSYSGGPPGSSGSFNPSCRNGPFQGSHGLTVTAPGGQSGTFNFTVTANQFIPVPIFPDIPTGTRTRTASITILQDPLVALEAKADALEAKADSLEIKADMEAAVLDEIKAGVIVLEGKADILEFKADMLEGKADKLEGKADKLEGKSDKLEIKADKIQKTLDTTTEMKRVHLQVIDIPNPNSFIREFLLNADEAGVPVPVACTAVQAADPIAPTVFVDVTARTTCTVVKAPGIHHVVIDLTPTRANPTILVRNPQIIEIRVKHSHGGFDHFGVILFDRRHQKNLAMGQ